MGDFDLDFIFKMVYIVMGALAVLVVVGVLVTRSPKKEEKKEEKK